MGWSSWKYYFATGHHSGQPKYYQFQYNGCLVGCGPVAWGMLFGWADQQAANTNNSYWFRWGIYRKDGGYGANVVAPKYMDNGVKNMIRELNRNVLTFCWFGSGATHPSTMIRASHYLSGRTGARLVTHYNSYGISSKSIRDYAKWSIKYKKTPAVIGIGWLTHYPLAYGYAYRKRTVRTCFIWCWEDTEYQRSFCINNGWGGGGDNHDWVSASTWFAGELKPS